jgi:hypothetical protein
MILTLMAGYKRVRTAILIFILIPSHSLLTASDSLILHSLLSSHNVFLNVQSIKMKYTPTILSVVLAANQVVASPWADGYNFAHKSGVFGTDAAGSTIPKGTYVSTEGSWSSAQVTHIAGSQGRSWLSEARRQDQGLLSYPSRRCV